MGGVVGTILTVITAVGLVGWFGALAWDEFISDRVRGWREFKTWKKAHR
jgi:hypothetical protein